MDPHTTTRNVFFILKRPNNNQWCAVRARFQFAPHDKPERNNNNIDDHDDNDNEAK